MSKEVNKITEEQLEKVNKQQTNLSEMLRSIGVLDVQKQNIHQKVLELSKEIEATKKELEEEYGSVNIDLKTGEYTDLKKEDTEEDAK